MWKKYCFSHPAKQASYSARKKPKKIGLITKGSSLRDLLTKGRKGKENCILRVLFGDIKGLLCPLIQMRRRTEFQGSNEQTEKENSVNCKEDDNIIEMLENNQNCGWRVPSSRGLSWEYPVVFVPVGIVKRAKSTGRWCL